MGLGYISVKVTSDWEAKINRLLGYAGVPEVPEGKLHATIIYDRRETLKEPLGELDQPNIIYSGTVMHVKEMGDRGDDGLLNAVAVYIASGELADLHSRMKALGYEHSYPDFEAHVSVGYDLTAEQMYYAKKQLNALVGETITFTDLSLKEIKKD